MDQQTTKITKSSPLGFEREKGVLLVLENATGNRLAICGTSLTDGRIRAARFFDLSVSYPLGGWEVETFEEQTTELVINCPTTQVVSTEFEYGPHFGLPCCLPYIL